MRCCFKRRKFFTLKALIVPFFYLFFLHFFTRSRFGSYVYGITQINILMFYNFLIKKLIIFMRNRICWFSANSVFDLGNKASILSTVLNCPFLSFLKKKTKQKQLSMLYSCISFCVKTNCYYTCLSKIVFLKTIGIEL